MTPMLLAVVALLPRPDAGLEDEARALSRRVGAETERIARTLGVSEARSIALHVHASPSRIRQTAPVGRRPPPGALGVAYPDLRRIDVALSGHAGALPMSREALALHEIAHVLVSDAAGGARVPRWLTEGIAVYFSGEYSFERFGALAGAVHSGQIRSVANLSRGFGGRDHEVSAAYAQAASFVAYLLEEDGPSALRDLLARLGEGEPIDEALSGAYGTPLTAIERDFRKILERRYRLWPALTGTGVLWGIAAILLVAAWRRRRRDRDRPWPEEEEEATPV